MDSVRRKLPIVLNAGSGGTYEMGRITAVFKAANDEAGDQASILEWMFDAKTKGVGASVNAPEFIHEREQLFRPPIFETFSVVSKGARLWI